VRRSGRNKSAQYVPNTRNLVNQKHVKDHSAPSLWCCASDVPQCREARCSFFIDRFTELCTFTLPPSTDAVDVHSAVSFTKEVVVTTTSRVRCENIGR